VVPRARAEAAPLLARLRAAFVPNRVLVVVAQGDELARLTPLVPLVEGKLAQHGQPTAYVCERGACQRPTGDPAVFAEQLGRSRSPGTVWPAAPPP
jgi:hypothetical protein